MRTDSAARVARVDTAKPGNGWTAAAVLGYVTAANMGEIDGGMLAAKRATSAGVKAFANQMVADHKAMQAEGATYASAHSLVADTTTDNVRDLMKGGRDEQAELMKKNAGVDWDKNFLDKEIDGHKHVLDKIQDAAKNTTDPGIKAMLEKASGKVQEHLTKAQDLRAKMK
ncbi:MAG: DUF4142 domain-containing protein [Gemmatimonadota bacterium]|nr:DUF4142 domain-containing protein [Gemmatimonadota bacterium]